MTGDADPRAVLQSDCPDCGFQVASILPANAVTTVRGLGDRYDASLTRPNVSDPDLRRRPDRTIWSALEYAAHVRDVIALWGWALHRTLTEKQPQLPGADSDLPDRAAAEGDYNRQDPAIVVRELRANADRMGRKVAAIRPDQWQCSALFGELAVTPLDIVRKVAHEGHHHLLDIERSLRA